VRRKFDNHNLVLPNGEVAVIGTHMNAKGEITIKLRLPNDYWGVTQIFRAAKGTKYVGGNCVVVIDRV
jgi:hypothetical protein